MSVLCNAYSHPLKNDMKCSVTHPSLLPVYIPLNVLCASFDEEIIHCWQQYTSYSCCWRTHAMCCITL